MSWIQKLFETYENCQAMVGSVSEKNEAPLLPISHSTQKAQIEIVIDQDGNFKRARIVPNSEARTIIPCTESSGGRTSGKAPHPLCDKLQYVAGDYKEYGGRKAYYFESYHELLKKWCESEMSHPKAIAVLRYIEKANMIKDLSDHQVLFIGADRKLLDKWDKKVIKSAPNSLQDDAFVRWIVEIPNDPQSSVWTDASLFQNWIKYYSSIKDGNALCYVTGEEVPAAEQHPRNIRRDGDGAKLISSGKTKDQKGKEKVNDPAGFTFLGRYSDAKQAFGVGYEVTQKAHNALRWLIARQGYKRGDQAIVAWSTTGQDIPDPLADPFSMLGFDAIQSDSEQSATTAQELALRLRRKIAGYHANLGDTTGIVVMGLDSATPGRIAISFYRELTGSDFLSRIDSWHESCAWIHNYRFVSLPTQKSGTKRTYIRFVGAPAPNDIAEAAYGSKVDDKLRKTTVERILPCIIDGQNIPRDVVESAVRRACNRASMEEWEWNKTLSIACALYKKCQKDYKEEDCDMSLDDNRTSRDYLYGRLLALADNLEQWALREASESRQTNAARLMQRFADHPFTTWRTIELALEPYKARLGNKSIKKQRTISEVVAMFAPDDFINDMKLSGEFLLGYHCQRQALWNQSEEQGKK